jgi:hypothetical protein
MTSLMSTTSAPRWKRTLAHALRLTRTSARSEPAPIEPLRELCRELVADLAPVQRYELGLCIAHARSAEDIWHLRSHLFGVISLQHGEHVARERLQRLDARWRNRQ